MSETDKKSLWRCWRLLSWKRRYLAYALAFVGLIVIFYTVENVRGTMALNAAKQRAVDAGIELDIGKLMTREMPPDEENFATCWPAMKTIGDFPSLEPEFRGNRLHPENVQVLPQRVFMHYAKSQDFSVLFHPRKKSHEEGAREVLRLLEPWKDELDEISEAAIRPHCVFDIVWSQNMMELEVPTSRSIVVTFQLRALAELGVGNIDGAVADVETILRAGKHLAEKPLFIHGIIQQMLVGRVASVLWEGVAQHQFDEGDLKRIDEAFSLLDLKILWEGVYRSEMAWGMRALAMFDSPGRRYRNWGQLFMGNVIFFGLILLLIMNGMIRLLNLQTGWFLQQFQQGGFGRVLRRGLMQKLI